MWKCFNRHFHRIYRKSDLLMILFDRLKNIFDFNKDSFASKLKSLKENMDIENLKNNEFGVLEKDGSTFYKFTLFKKIDDRGHTFLANIQFTP